MIMHKHMQVMNEVVKAIEAMSIDGPLRDHRPLQCNADDYLRMVRVCVRACVCVGGGGGGGGGVWVGGWGVVGVWVGGLCVRVLLYVCA